MIPKRTAEPRRPGVDFSLIRAQMPEDELNTQGIMVDDEHEVDQEAWDAAMDRAMGKRDADRD